MGIHTNTLLRLLQKGGPGSGNFGHAGRPGEIGGSSSDGGGISSGGLSELESEVVKDVARPQWRFNFEADAGKEMDKYGVSDATDRASNDLISTLNQMMRHTGQIADVDARSAMETELKEIKTRILDMTLPKGKSKALYAIGSFASEVSGAAGHLAHNLKL